MSEPQLTWNSEDEVVLTWFPADRRVDLSIDLETGEISWAARLPDKTFVGADNVATLPRELLALIRSAKETP